MFAALQRLRTAPRSSSLVSGGLRNLSKKAATAPTGRQTVTLFPGDGIGPEISKAVQDIFKAAGVPIDWELHNVSTHAVTPDGKLISQEALDSCIRNRVGLKGPLATPIGKGHKSLNLTLRQELKLYANLRPCRSIPGLKTKYDNVDLVIVRENTEGEYSGLEHEVVPGVVEALKVITREASQRCADFAFQYAAEQGRKRVTIVHKGNIMKMSDGLFLQCALESAKKHPEVEVEDVLLDVAVMQLAKDPHAYDVMVMPNLYGDIISDLCAGLIGGLGLTPSGNIGERAAVFEAVHGTAPDIAGKNLANPTAMLMSACMMLRHLKWNEYADRIERAALACIAEPQTRTKDLGGMCSTSEFTAAICRKIDSM